MNKQKQNTKITMVTSKMSTTFLWALLCLPFFTYAQTQTQKPPLKFDALEHNFGTIKEEGGNVTHVFKFINEGKDSVRIKRVDADCGCTTPSFIDTYVLSGDSGYVQAEFEPYTRPGEFDKHLTVTTTHGEVKLRIFGFVEARELGEDEQRYPSKMGALWAVNSDLHFGEITTQKTVSKDFGIYNGGVEPITFDLAKSEVPDHITLKIVPENLKPGQHGSIQVTYDPKKANDYGYLVDRILIATNDKVKEEEEEHGHGGVIDAPDTTPDFSVPTQKDIFEEEEEAEDLSGMKEFEVRVSVVEYFPQPIDTANSPRISLSQKSVDYGKAKKGTMVTKEVTITNNGKKPLVIRKLKPTCSCVTAEISKEEIKPGKSAKLKITFDTTDRSGKQVKSVYIFNNDPLNAQSRVMVKGYVID